MDDTPYTPRDLAQVDVTRPKDLDYWARTLETDQDKVRRAVEKVGPILEKVKQELGIAGV